MSHRSIGEGGLYVEFSKITFYNVIMLRFADTFYLVRHGQTDKNRKGEVQGWSNVPLNSIGMAQAAALIPIAKEIGITDVITSDLSRAEKTGWFIADGLGIEIVQDWRLRECDFGNYTGAKDMLFNQETVKKIQAETKTNKAESIDDVFGRVKSFLDDLKCDSKTLIVSHGATMRFIMYYMENNGRIDKNAFIQYACTTHIPNAQIFAFTTRQKFEMVR